MQDTTIFITGGTDGIGRATALALARQGRKVVIAGRDIAKGTRVCQQLKQQSNNPHIRYLPLNLASFAAVRETAAAFARDFDRLDVLINNAGVFSSKLRLTDDGFEWHFGINHLGHFLLTHLLKPQLLAAPAPRVVNVSSVAQYHGKINFDNLRGECGPAAFNGLEAYAQSKLANTLFTREMARREKRIVTNALHPGAVRTRFGNKYSHWGLSLFWHFWKPFMCDPLRGAKTSLYLATAPETAKISGAFFDDHQRLRDVGKIAGNDLLACKLWKESCRMTEVEKDREMR
jgi:NAD(P)-dependent dehydrogenase (short-subunit alcohol dehydrogenase family)